MCMCFFSPPLIQLQECYDSVQGQVDGYRAAAEGALRKEQRATHMVAELTAIVREQKGRLAELGRARQDSVQELKVWSVGCDREEGGKGERGRDICHFHLSSQERVGELEAEVREKHKLEVKVQSLQEVLRVLLHICIVSQVHPPLFPSSARTTQGSAPSCLPRSRC